jgi:hypothetical protein
VTASPLPITAFLLARMLLLVLQGKQLQQPHVIAPAHQPREGGLPPPPPPPSPPPPVPSSPFAPRGSGSSSGIGSHGNGRRTAMEGAFVMVGRCGGDENLGFNSFMYSYCSYVRKLGSC